MSFSDEQRQAAKLVAIAVQLQPQVSVVGSQLQIKSNGQNIAIALFQPTPISTKVVSYR